MAWKRSRPIHTTPEPGTGLWIGDSFRFSSDHCALYVCAHYVYVCICVGCLWHNNNKRLTREWYCVHIFAYFVDHIMYRYIAHTAQYSVMLLSCDGLSCQPSVQMKYLQFILFCCNCQPWQWWR